MGHHGPPVALSPLADVGCGAYVWPVHTHTHTHTVCLPACLPACPSIYLYLLARPRHHPFGTVQAAKIRIQAQPNFGNNAFEVVGRIIDEEGFVSMYRSYVPLIGAVCGGPGSASGRHISVSLPDPGRTQKEPHVDCAIEACGAPCGAVGVQCRVCCVTC